MSTLAEESLQPSPRRASRSGGRPVPRQRPRGNLRFVVAGLVIVAAIGYMIYAAMQSGAEYYLTASEVKAMGEKAIGQPIKVGGRVVDGSVQHEKGANSVAFALADEKQSLQVAYTGVIPDSFQPNVDVIVEGKMGADGTFKASNLLAKCASKYEPK